MSKFSTETPSDIGEPEALSQKTLSEEKSERHWLSIKNIRKLRLIVPIVLASALSSQAQTEEGGDQAESLINMIARQCNEMVLRLQKRTQDEELIKTKVNECFLLAINREELIVEKQEEDLKLRKKMKPLLSVIPKDIQKRLQGFDPQKFETLSQTFIVIDDEELGEDSKAAYKFLVFNAEGEPISNPDPLIVLRNLDYYKSANFLAALLVHEIYGHGFDKELIDTEKALYDSNGYSIEEFERVLKETEDRRHRSEIRARYVDNAFADWLISKGFMKKEEIDAADPLTNDSFVPEFYYLYKEAVASNDWSKFKRRIIAHYELADDPEPAVSQLSAEQRKGDYTEVYKVLIEFMEGVVSKKFSHLITPEKPWS